MKLYYSTVVLLATLALTACGSSDDNGNMSPTSISEDVTVLKKGSGQTCPDFSGYYICEDTINGEKQEPVKQKIVMEQGENKEISFQEITTESSNPLDEALSNIIFPGGEMTFIADGEIHKAPGSEITQLLGGVDMKYSVDCNLTQFSFHFFMDKDNTSKVIMSKQTDGSIKGKSIDITEGEKSITEGVCKPITEEEYNEGLTDEQIEQTKNNENPDTQPETEEDNDPLGWLWYLLGMK